MKNYWLDLLLLLFGLFCMASGVILDFHLVSERAAYYRIRTVHLYTGYVMLAGCMLHVAWHMNWLKAMTKKKVSAK